MKYDRIKNLLSIDTTKLLIEITGCIESSKNIREFITDIRSILNKSGFPIFNLSFVINENAREYLLINADLSKLNLKNAVDSENEISELNIIRKLQLTEKNDYNENIIPPLADGIIVKTTGIEFDDKNIRTSNFEKKKVINSFFSLHAILNKLYSGSEVNITSDEYNEGEIVIYPIISDNNFIGTIDFFFPEEKGRLTQEETRLLTIISRIIGNSYRNFINIHRASTSEDKFRAIFESTPLAILVVNSDYEVIETNNKFKAWYPDYRENSDNLCYKIFPHKMKTNPCGKCAVTQTFETGRGESREIKYSKNNEITYYEIKTSPIFSGSGEITAVMKTVENITKRVLADKQIKRKNRKLELAVTQKIDILKDKEKNLTAVVNAVRRLEEADTSEESIEKIIKGYMELELKGVIFTLYKNNKIYIEKIHPEENLNDLNENFGVDFSNIRIIPEKNHENPFVISFESANPIFFIGKDGMFDFFKSFFPDASKKILLRALNIYKGLSIVVFPLHAKSRVEGVIAVISELSALEKNFEYYQLLSNSAALEIGRLKHSEEMMNSELKYRNLVDSSRDMISLCDNYGNIQFSNKTFWERVGGEEKISNNLNIYDFFSSQNKLLLKEVIENFIKTKKKQGPVEILIGNTKSEIFWAEMTINSISNGNSGLQLVFRDITDKNNMLEKIEDLSLFRKKILHNNHIGIFTCNLKGLIQSWNRGAANILGYSEKDVINRNIADLIISGYEGSLKKIPGNKPGGSDEAGREIVFKKKNNERVSVMFVESSIKDQNNNPVKIISFFFNITEKVNLQVKSLDLLKQLSEARRITILSLAKLTEYRDIETGAHLERIMKYTELLANELSTFKDYKNYISNEYVTDLVNSSMLHDIGKVGIPDDILHKPNKLSREEFEVMKNHSVIGGDAISDAEQKVQGRTYLNLGKEIAYYHHEKWDGTGYPEGLKGNDIPLSARIVSIADMYDALRNKRPYKEAFSHQKTMGIILNCANTHFNESMLEAFLNCQKELESASKIPNVN